MSEQLELSAAWLQQFFIQIPHNRALGITAVSWSEGRACMRLPYHERLVGNPATGVLHGGAVTALLDACCGAAVFMKQADPIRIATLDLRIDYLKPALPSYDVVAEAECYKTTRHIAFVRSLAYHTHPDDPIASATGTFMLIGDRTKEMPRGETQP